MESSTRNFIVIFNDAADIQKFLSELDLKSISKGRTVLVLDDFTRNYSLIEKALRDISRDNFIVLTTKEGGRGIDYKGINIAHVIVAFEPESYSLCV